MRVCTDVQLAALAFAAALAIACGAGAIERHRCARAFVLEYAYAQRERQSGARLAAGNLLYRRAVELVRLDGLAQKIVSSGDDHVRRIAAVANAVPRRTWLTAIRGESTGLSLEGGASDFGRLGTLMRSFMQSDALHNPSIKDVTLVSDRPHSNTVRYELHVDAVR
ncbi:MAG: PilN domain-containing protein [Candidatus Baltobacteraceae bacterium]